jgi:hypothetical protein
MLMLRKTQGSRHPSPPTESFPYTIFNLIVSFRLEDLLNDLSIPTNIDDHRRNPDAIGILDTLLPGTAKR